MNGREGIGLGLKGNSDCPVFKSKVRIYGLDIFVDGIAAD